MARQNQVKHKENLASKKDNESLEQSWDSAEIPSEKLLGAVWVNVYQERHKSSIQSRCRGMTGQLLQLFSVLISCNSKFVLIFSHVYVPLAEIALLIFLCLRNKDLSPFLPNCQPNQKNYLIQHVTDISQDGSIHFFPYKL